MSKTTACYGYSLCLRFQSHSLSGLAPHVYKQCVSFLSWPRYSPVAHPHIGNWIMRCSTSTKPASLIRSGSRRGARRSFNPSMLSRYRALHWLSAWPCPPISKCYCTGSVQPTICQTAVVGLSIVIHLNHLGPPTRPCYSEEISNILGPSVDMNSASNHPRMD